MTPTDESVTPVEQDADRSPRTPLVIYVIGALAAGVLAWVMWPTNAHEGTPEGRFEAFEGDVGTAPSVESSDQTGDAEPASARRDAGTRGSVVVLEDRVARPGSSDEQERMRPDTSGGNADHGSTDSGYTDPTNDEVLGPQSWMERLPEDEREDIDRQLDLPPPEQFPLDLGVRREGIELAKAVVFDCYDALKRRQPQREGRIIVSFDVVASGSQATLENVAVPTNVELEDPQFERCIVDGLNGLKVPATDEGEMHVEYPFLFDLEGKRQ